LKREGHEDEKGGDEYKKSLSSDGRRGGERKKKQ
jgi:hypothetical protein